MEQGMRGGEEAKSRLSVSSSPADRADDRRYLECDRSDAGGAGRAAVDIQCGEPQSDRRNHRWGSGRSVVHLAFMFVAGCGDMAPHPPNIADPFCGRVTESV